MSELTQLPDYDWVATALNRLESDADAAEVHGILCGMLCMNLEQDEATWRGVLAIHPHDKTDLLSEEADQCLSEIFQSTWRTLASRDLDLNLDLLLPGDEQPLDAGVAAMGLWCEGMMHGLACGGLTNETDMSPEAQDFIEDLVSISSVDPDSGGDSEEDESDFFELVEYVRMGVLMLQAEFSPAPPSDLTMH